MTSTQDPIAAGRPLLHDGNLIARAGADLAARFQLADRLIVVSGSGDILHLPRAVCDLAGQAVDRACEAFQRMSLVSNEQITRYYECFAAHLAPDDIWTAIAALCRCRFGDESAAT